MRPKEDHRRAVDSIRSYYSPQVTHAEVASREYAQLALRSLITLNAGVAVAYPAIAEVFIKEVGFASILWPTSLAVLGAVVGIVCAYLVYFNHGFEAQQAYCQMELEVVQSDEFFDADTYWTFQKHRSNSKEHWEKWRDRYSARRNAFFFGANIAGIASLLCFSASVLWFAFAVS